MMGTVFAQGVQWIRADFHLHKRRATSCEELQRLLEQAGLVHADETPVAGLSASDADTPYFKPSSCSNSVSRSLSTTSRYRSCCQT